MQTQQNNNWTAMPRGDDHTRVQSNLVFQPLMSLRLTEKQGLVIRPMVTIVNSIPHFATTVGQNERTAGFGDTVLAFALPRSLLGGRLTVGARLTFISLRHRRIAQPGYMAGRACAGAAFLGKNFITYAFMQQWFKVGGRRRGQGPYERNVQLTYMLAKGFTIGTQPNLSVDWEAREDNRVAFSIGPPIGKLCKCGGLPTLFQVQVQSYPLVQTSSARSGTSSCKRLRRSRHSSRKRSSDCRGVHGNGLLITRKGRPRR